MKSIVKHWKKIAICIVTVLAVGIACGWLLPSRQQVQRSSVMRATPQRVLPWIATPKRWPEWTAWTSARFPDLVTRFEGPDTGPGAIMIASGKSSGDGTVTIVRADADTSVVYTLDFAHGTQLFDGVILFTPSSNGSLTITWTLTADLGNNPFKRWAGLAMDALMGTDMGVGLENLRQRVEIP